MDWRGFNVWVEQAKLQTCDVYEAFALFCTGQVQILASETMRQSPVNMTNTSITQESNRLRRVGGDLLEPVPSQIFTVHLVLEEVWRETHFAASQIWLSHLPLNPWSHFVLRNPWRHSTRGSRSCPSKCSGHWPCQRIPG